MISLFHRISVPSWYLAKSRTWFEEPITWITLRCRRHCISVRALYVGRLPPEILLSTLPSRCIYRTLPVSHPSLSLQLHTLFLSFSPSLLFLFLTRRRKKKKWKRKKKKLKLNENEKEIRETLAWVIDVKFVKLRNYFNGELVSCLLTLANCDSYNFVKGIGSIVQEYPTAVSRLLNPFSISDYTCSPPKPSS